MFNTLVAKISGWADRTLQRDVATMGFLDTKSTDYHEWIRAMRIRVNW
jgi:hypothetical protein